MRSSLIPSDTPNTFKHFLLAHLTMPCIVPLCARLYDGALVRPYGLLPDLITYRCYVFVNWMKYEVKWSEVTQSCPTLWDPVDYSPPGSSVHGILQARILEWVAIPFSRGSSWPRDQTQVSRIAGRGFNLWATREDWMKYISWYILLHIKYTLANCVCILLLIHLVYLYKI